LDGAKLGFDSPLPTAHRSRPERDHGKATVDAGGHHADERRSGGNDIFYFGAIRNGSDNQTVTLRLPMPPGEHTLTVASITPRRSLDEALASINSKLQQSNDATLSKDRRREGAGTSTGSTLEGVGSLSTFG